MDDAARDATGADATVYNQVGMQALLDLSAPQENYRNLIESGGYLCPVEGVGLSFARADTEFILRNHQLFSSRVEMNLGNVRPLIPLNVDPPNHSKYRKLLDPLFAPKRMDEQEEDITRRTNAFIDAFIEHGECNFTEEFAELLPSSVFLGLLGLPEDQLRMFLRLRDGILHPEKMDPAASTDFAARAAVMQATGQEIYRYFGDLVERRRAEPADDIITRFLHADVGGDKLSTEDILDIAYLFLIAGLDTVSDSLTCFFAFLATHPDHRRQIVEDPALIPAAVEELLRWESPVPGGVPRVATEDVVLPTGATVPKGTAVMVSYGAANVDPAGVTEPFEVRFDREVNPHIAFGGGVHRCLGSHLARRELRIALREWHRRIPDYRLKEGHEVLEYPPGLRHVKDLMLAWD
ncbi:MAG TPA: cytochrome P450 [Acidimicrobiales bacterium]|nr:cytochrome P450 [Acidimicrobiales bacterium]